MFNGLLTKLTADDNPRLHRIPFMLIWIAAYGLGWIAAGVVGGLTDSLLYDLMGWYTNAGIISMVCGLAFGGTLALTQGWILRRRYGFVPRFWRIGTILGMVIATGAFFFIMDNFFWDTLWQAGSVWIITFGLFQTAVLFRVNAKAWLLVALAMLTAIIGILLETFVNFPYDDIGALWAIVVGSGIQAIGTGMIMMHLMANPREGIVPKREDDIKAKARMRQGMHPVTFIGFWSAGILTGWGVFFLCMILWFLTLGDTDLGYNIYNWISDIMPWFAGGLMGAIIGGVAGIAQKWLMHQHSKITIRHWIIFSVIGWAIGGALFWEYVSYYSHDMLTLGAWFALPALLQTIPMWRAMRGGWLWVFTGVASAIVATVIHTQFDWTYSAELYTVIFGSVASAIISGATFVLLQAQQQRATEQTNLETA